MVCCSDCKAFVQAFKSPTSQEYDPIARAHLIEIGKWTGDLRHIEAKDNQMADYLSRAGTVGTAYIEEEESLKIDSVFLEALEEVSLRTLTPKALAEA